MPALFFPYDRKGISPLKQRVVIIGGGILGACAAWALSESGYPVTLLEKGDLASGASGANLGQISLIDREEPWHIHAALESLDIFSSLNDRWNLEYEQSGGVIVLEDESQYTASLHAAALMEGYGVPVAYLRGEQTRQVEPILDSTQIYGLLHCPQEGKINPLHTTLAFLDMARDQGAALCPNTPVTGFQRDSSGAVTGVCTPEKVFPADIVVNAAGAWSGQVAGLLDITLPVDFHRATAFVSQPVAPVIRGPVVGGGMFLQRESMHMHRHIGTGCIQTAHGSIIIAQATEDAPLGSRDITLPGICLVAQRFLRFFPSLRDLEIVRAWACVTPFAPDGLPVFGFSPQAPNFFTMSGFKGAFSTAPAVARRLADFLDGGPLWEGGHFAPERPLQTQQEER